MGMPDRARAYLIDDGEGHAILEDDGTLRIHWFPTFSPTSSLLAGGFRLPNRVSF